MSQLHIAYLWLVYTNTFSTLTSLMIRPSVILSTASNEKLGRGRGTRLIRKYNPESSYFCRTLVGKAGLTSSTMAYNDPDYTIVIAVVR